MVEEKKQTSKRSTSLRLRSAKTRMIVGTGKYSKHWESERVSVVVVQFWLYWNGTMHGCIHWTDVPPNCTLTHWFKHRRVCKVRELGLWTTRWRSHAKFKLSSQQFGGLVTCQADTLGNRPTDGVRVKWNTRRAQARRQVRRTGAIQEKQKTDDCLSAVQLA